MKTTIRSSRTVRYYVLDVQDGEVRDCPYSRAGRRYRVAKINVEKESGNVSSVKFGGPVLKKDGTDSSNWQDERPWSQKDWPEWLHAAIKGLA